MRFTLIAWISSTLALNAQDSRIADAVRAGQFAEALALLEQGADPNGLDTRGNSPLSWAAASGNIEIAKALLDRQALINAQHDGPEYDALHLAAYNRRTAMIDFLLSRGVDPGLGDWSPILQQYRVKLMRIGKLVDRVKQAVWGHNRSSLRTLLAQSPPDARQSSLNAALCVAADEGDLTMARELLEWKANPASDLDGKSALARAARLEHAEIVKLLLSRGIRSELVREAAFKSGPKYPAKWFPVNRTEKAMSPKLQQAFGEVAREPAQIEAAIEAGDREALDKLVRSGAAAYWLSHQEVAYLSDGAPMSRYMDAAIRHNEKAIVRILTEVKKRHETITAVLTRLSTACQMQPSKDCDRIITSAKWFMNRTDRWRSRPVFSDDYFVSLQTMADTLQTNPGIQVIKEIADELEAKHEYCVQNNIGMGGSVSVVVRTRNQQREIPNWQVYYLLKIYEHNPRAAPGAFLTWSSPTSADLEPGRYWFWAVNPATHVQTERKLVPLNGARSVAMDLYVP